jgi:hypothetical protein
MLPIYFVPLAFCAPGVLSAVTGLAAATTGVGVMQALGAITEGVVFFLDTKVRPGAAAVNECFAWCCGYVASAHNMGVVTSTKGNLSKPKP